MAIVSVYLWVSIPLDSSIKFKSSDSVCIIYTEMRESVRKEDSKSENERKREGQGEGEREWERERKERELLGVRWDTLWSKR